MQRKAIMTVFCAADDAAESWTSVSVEYDPPLEPGKTSLVAQQVRAFRNKSIGDAVKGGGPDAVVTGDGGPEEAIKMAIKLQKEKKPERIFHLGPVGEA